MDTEGETNDAVVTVCHLSLSAKHYMEAIEWYSYAIEKDPTVAVYYGNRSFAHLKMESYGFALSDASTALDLDRTYIKVRPLLSHVAVSLWVV